jgi:hypothetical protein
MINAWHNADFKTFRCIKVDSESTALRFSIDSFFLLGSVQKQVTAYAACGKLHCAIPARLLKTVHVHKLQVCAGRQF